MGSGNTKNCLKQDEKIENKTLNQEKPRQQQDNKAHNNLKENKNVLNPDGQIQKETKENEDKKSLDSDDEDIQPAEDIKLKLSERGFTDATLLSHCEKTPKYFEYFTSLYEAIKVIEEKLKGEDYLSIQRQATVFSSCYSKVKSKVTLGNFLAESGFAKLFREIYLKLDSDFPDLLTYDRELEENLKKSPGVEKSVENNKTEETDTVNNVGQLPSESNDQSGIKPSESGVSPAKSSDQLTEASLSPAKPSHQLSEASPSPGKPSDQPTEASLNPAKPSDQLTEASPSPVKPSDQLTEATPVKLNDKPTEDCVQLTNSTVQPTESKNIDQPAKNQPSESGDQPTVSNIQPTKSSLQPGDSSNQPDVFDVKENIKKPEEKKPANNALLKAQDLFNKMMVSSINYTDACDNMNLALSEEGVVQLLVDAVAKLKDCTGQHVKYMNEEGSLKKRTIRGGILTKVLGTLHNMSKRVPTRPKFHVCNAVTIILPLIDDEVNRFALDALLIMAYLIDEENNKLIMANEGPIKYLISMINKATKKTIHRYLGYTNSELAQGLAQIAINDNNKKQIVACGAIPVLTNMIEKAKIENERKTAAEALWVLAFDEENRQIMKNDEKCMGLLHKLKKSESDKTRKAASGALWEIEGKQNVATALSTDEKNGSSTTNHVMISYQWDVQKTLIQVKDRLQAAGYRVWMDLEQMGGSTLEAMARAVENSAVVLICVSQKYKESSNCRSEAEYAFQLHKDIIPLMMESNYRPDGWLGMIMGSKLWIDFSQRHISKVEGSVKDLMRELRDRGRGESEIVPVCSVDVVDAKPAVDISGWTNDDVMNWMKGFGLGINNKNAVENLTGPVLTRLHAFRNEVSPEFYYSSLKEDFGFPRMIDVLVFSDELKKLLS